MLPTVADVLTLDVVRRGAPRVLVAADRLDALVRWVHVIELAETGHLLRGGELVLSTGIALPPDPDGLARYVAGLASAGVSALAVELGARYVRELPRALVGAAAVHRLPLIVLGAAATPGIHRPRGHGADQDEIVSQASALAGAPVILADLAHRALACAPAGQDVATLLSGFAARSRGATVPGRIGYDPAVGWLVATVGARNLDWGRLIFVLSAPPDAGGPVLAERAATTLALARLVSDPRQAHSPERIAHRGVLAAVAGPGYADPVDLQARIIALGVPLAGRRVLPVVVGLSDRDVSPQAVADRVAVACFDLGAPAICGVLDHASVGALLALPSGAVPDDVLTRLAARLRAGGLKQSDVIGVGPMVASLAQARNALREAAEAAGAAARYPATSQPFVRLADLRLAGLLYQLRHDPRVLAFAERELGSVLSHDERAGTDLIGVLTSYLDAGGNKAETAQRLGLARPTLYQRVRQIEQLLGISLDSAESRLAVHAALRPASLAMIPAGRMKLRRALSPNRRRG